MEETAAELSPRSTCSLGNAGSCLGHLRLAMPGCVQPSPCARRSDAQATAAHVPSSELEFSENGNLYRNYSSEPQPSLRPRCCRPSDNSPRNKQRLRSRVFLQTRLPLWPPGGRLILVEAEDGMQASEAPSACRSGSLGFGLVIRMFKLTFTNFPQC